MDKWTQKDIEKVRVGGNNQFRDFLESHSEYNAEWTIEEKYNSQLISLYRDKITMESAGEIWIEEESPVYLQIKENSPQNVSQSATLTEINLTPQDVMNEKEKIPMTKDDGVKVVEVDPEEDLNTFSRLGLGFGVASKFMKETADMAKSELSEFKSSPLFVETNQNLAQAKQNLSSAISGWGCWASSALTKATDTLHQELTKNDVKNAEENSDSDLGGSFWSGFGQKRPPPMCMSVQTISEPEDN